MYSRKLWIQIHNNQIRITGRDRTVFRRQTRSTRKALTRLKMSCLILRHKTIPSKCRVDHLHRLKLINRQYRKLAASASLTNENCRFLCKIIRHRNLHQRRCNKRRSLLLLPPLRKFLRNPNNFNHNNKNRSQHQTYSSLSIISLQVRTRTCLPALNQTCNSQ